MPAKKKTTINKRGILNNYISVFNCKVFYQATFNEAKINVGVGEHSRGGETL